jgi:hypothetical protein
MTEIFAGDYSIVGTFFVFAALAVVDRVGRRPMIRRWCFLIGELQPDRLLLVLGYPVIASVLLLESLFQWRYVRIADKPGNGASLFFIYIYIIFYRLIDAPSFS